MYDFVYMTFKDYTIEVSMNGTDWYEVYAGVVPSTAYYNASCPFENILCKYVKINILSNYDRRGYQWALGFGCKVYGVNACNSLFENEEEMYGIPK